MIVYLYGIKTNFYILIKQSRKRFSPNIGTGVQICINDSLVFNTVQPTTNSAIRKPRFILITVYRHEIIIKERCFVCIGFFLLDNTNTIPFTKISQHLEKPVKRYLYEILVVVLSKIDILLPEFVDAKNHCVDLILDTPLNDPFCQLMHEIRYLILMTHANPMRLFGRDELLICILGLAADGFYHALVVWQIIVF